MQEGRKEKKRENQGGRKEGKKGEKRGRVRGQEEENLLIKIPPSTMIGSEGFCPSSCVGWGCRERPVFRQETAAAAICQALTVCQTQIKQPAA